MARQKFLVINYNAFSKRGLKQKKKLDFTDLPWPVLRFLSAFPKPFIVADEFSALKVTQPMQENKKSTRTRMMKLLNKTGHRLIMSGTSMSKSPLNLMDPYEFLNPKYFPETMWEFAEKYCIMETIRVGKGRRVLISQKSWDEIRDWLQTSYIDDGEAGVEAMKYEIWKRRGIDYEKQEHIINHKKYTPFLNVDKLMKRIAGDTIFVDRKDLFDVSFEKFVLEPIHRPFEVTSEAKRIGNDLVKQGFTDNMVLGKAAALELQIRLQDICNGFEPIKQAEDEKVTLKPFKENPKLDAMEELLEEIDVGTNQVVIWSSRKSLLRECAGRLTAAGISYVLFDGDASEDYKEEAKKKFQERSVQVFLANQASAAYGINCLAECSYAIYLCVSGSVEQHYQSQHRLLRGQLSAPKFAYAIYAKGSVEERMWTTLQVGQELISAHADSLTADLFRFL